MKNKLSIFFLLNSMMLYSQNTQFNVIQKGDTYRFEVVNIIEYETFTDTLVQSRFPDNWLSRSDFSEYIANIALQHEKIISNINTQIADEQAMADMYINMYQSINGDNSYFTYKSQKLVSQSEGFYTLTQKDNGDITYLYLQNGNVYTYTQDNIPSDWGLEIPIGEYEFLTANMTAKINNKKYKFTDMGNFWKGKTGSTVFILKRQ